MASKKIRRSKHPKLVKGILKGGAVLLSLTVATTIFYSVIHFSPDDKVEGALGNDLSTVITTEYGETRDPLEIIDPSGVKYEVTDIVEEGASDGQIHDEDGKNDINRYEEDDPFGTFEVGQGEATEMPEQPAEKDPATGEEIGESNPSSTDDGPVA